MPKDAASYQLLMRWRNCGDQDAVAELYQRYAARLIALARGKLSARMSRRLDPEDIIQSVCRSFFVRVRDGKINVQPGLDLWQLLAVITTNKVLRQLERQLAQKRSIRNEEDWDKTGPDGWEAVAEEPSPGEVTAITEECERALTGLNPTHRQMVELYLFDHSVADIARSVQRSQTMVRRVVESFRERLQRRLGDSGDA